MISPAVDVHSLRRRRQPHFRPIKEIFVGEFKGILVPVRLLRWLILLIECAGHVLGPLGKDSSLRQWGLHLASRGGKQARNKTVVAVARKLAVLLHRIWIAQEPYVPFYAKAA